MHPEQIENDRKTMKRERSGVIMIKEGINMLNMTWVSLKCARLRNEGTVANTSDKYERAYAKRYYHSYGAFCERDNRV